MTPTDQRKRRTLAQSNNWMADAACRDKDPELFYPVGSGELAFRQSLAAIRVCADCPVVNQCRGWAHTASNGFGVWAGQTADQRRAARHRQMRAGARP